jgi:hypothetical protein
MTTTKKLPEFGRKVLGDMVEVRLVIPADMLVLDTGEGAVVELVGDAAVHRMAAFLLASAAGIGRAFHHIVLVEACEHVWTLVQDVAAAKAAQS